MKYRRKASILIKRKHLRIIVPVLVAVIILIVVISVISTSNQRSEKQKAVEHMTKIGVINIGLRGDLGSLCRQNAETGEFEGLEKDIADEIIARLFGDDILVNYIPVNSETKDALIRFGDIDIALGASLKKKISGICFTKSYYTAGSAFLVMDGSMKSQDGLNGRPVAVVQNSYAAGESEDDEEITRMESYLAVHDIDADVKMYASYPEAVEALRGGHVGGVCANEIFLNLHGKKGMLILPERFMPNRLVIEVGEPLGKFCDVVTDTIAEMQQDGTMEALIEKWNLIDYAALKE